MNEPGAGAIGAVIEDYTRLARALHFGQQGSGLPWGELNLTLSQLKLLGLLACRPNGRHGRELAELLGVGPSAVTALVDRVVEAGYARREDDPRDRRVIWVRLTDRGRALLERLATGQRGLLGELLEQLGPDDLQTVGRGLRLLRRAAERRVLPSAPESSD